MEFTVNGKTAFASTGGKPHVPGQPNMVFIHGSGQSRLTWTQQCRKAAYRGYNVLALDLPGHGRSDGPAPKDVEETAQWVLSAMDAVGFETATVVGHSQGVLEVLELAASSADRIEKAVLVAGAMAIPVNDALVGWAESKQGRAYNSMTQWGLGEIGHKHENTVPGHSHLGAGVRVMEGNEASTLHADLNACNAYQNGKVAAAAITVPTLVVLGADDKMTPIKFGRKMADTIPGARLVEMADTGHFIPVERPYELNKAIFDFIEG